MTAAARDVSAADADAIIALNDGSVEFTSPLDHASLGALLGDAAVARVIEVAGAVGAFLIALREGASYDSPNYRWLAERYERFLYVDRVVVGEAYRGRGLGRALYEDVFARARADGVELVTCEFNLLPPNDASAAFHAALGFAEVGQLDIGAKRVSLQARAV